MMTRALVLLGGVWLFGCSEREQPVRASMTNEAYQNPVDRKGYVASGGWKEYKPESPKPPVRGQKVILKKVRLLTAQHELAGITSAEELGAFMKAAQACAIASLTNSAEPFTLLVQFKCTPTGHEVQMAHDGPAKQELLQQTYDALGKLSKLNIKEGEANFQMELDVVP
jgi:hypothetical protein